MKFGFERVASPRPFLRFGNDEPLAGQDPMDRGARDVHLIVVFEMPTDRVRSRVEALAGQFPAVLEDQLDRARRSRVGRAARASRSGFERGVAFGSVAGNELVDPRARGLSE